MSHGILSLNLTFLFCPIFCWFLIAHHCHKWNGNNHAKKSYFLVVAGRERKIENSQKHANKTVQDLGGSTNLFAARNRCFWLGFFLKWKSKKLSQCCELCENLSFYEFSPETWIMFVLVTHTQQQLTSSARLFLPFTREFFDIFFPFCRRRRSCFFLSLFLLKSTSTAWVWSAVNEGEKPTKSAFHISPSPPQSNQKIVRSRFLTLWTRRLIPSAKFHLHARAHVKL